MILASKMTRTIVQIIITRGRVTATLFLAMALVAGCSGGGGDGPSHVGNVVDADGKRQWQIDMAVHPKVLSDEDYDFVPTVTNCLAEITNILIDATTYWTNDIDVAAKDEKDIEVGVEFVFKPPCDLYVNNPFSAGNLQEDKYCYVTSEYDLQALWKTNGIREWVLIVVHTPPSLMTTARTYVGHARCIIPVKACLDPGLYAHEFGHCAGLSERDQVEGGSCAIMQSIPQANGSDLLRQLAKPDEKNKMEKWDWTAPWQ